MSRRVALTTPAVTVGWVSSSRMPNGLPIAIAHSPTTSESLSPSGATGSFGALDLEHGEVVDGRVAQHLRVEAAGRRAGSP